MRVLQAAGQTEAGLTRRLTRAGYAAAAVEDARRRLVERGYLDDQDFAASRAARRLRQGRGARVVAAELRQKGVAPEIINEVIEGIDRDDQLERARAIAAKLLPARGRERTLAALLRRGYSHWLARTALEEAVLRALSESAGFTGSKEEPGVD